MTRSYRPQPTQRITQPLVAYGRPPRDPAIGTSRFTCFRLVPGGATFVAIELHHSTTRMFAFVTA